MRIYRLNKTVVFADDVSGDVYKIRNYGKLNADTNADGTKIILLSNENGAVETPAGSYLAPSSFKDANGVKYATSADGTTAAVQETLAALSDILGFNQGGGSGVFADTIVANTLANLPPPVGGKIAIPAGTSVMVPGQLDLEGNYLEMGFGGVTGLNADTSRLTSTGLSPSQPLIVMLSNCVLRNITIENVGIGFAIDNINAAYDWQNTNFENIGTVGTINDCQFLIIDTVAFINSGNLTFSGTIISFVASPNCIWRGLVGTGTQIIFAPTFVALARVRIQDSQIQTAAAQVGIDLQAGATIQLGGFILDKVRFSNAGIPIQGINGDDNRADFQDCTGGNVINSATISEYYMVNNVTATTITDANFVKVAGTTTNGLYIQRFTNTNNRATYTGTVTQFFTVSAIVSANAGNNQLLIMRIAKNGVTIAASEMQATTSGNGRSESIKCQTVVLLSQNDYIEVFIANSTAPTNITATELNVIIQAA